VPYIGSGEAGQQADPLPQAFVLTAIVIAFSITMFMVTLAITTTGDDDTEDEERSPAKVLISAPSEETEPAAAPESPQLTTEDTQRRMLHRIDTQSTAVERADTGGPHQSPEGTFGPAHGSNETQQGKHK